MQHFDSDYMEGAHPAILARLQEINMEKNPGYGTDAICAAAREKIRAACALPDAAVYFLVGGTQTNATVITALLRPYEGVIATEKGHIETHEAGAIEANGHKVLTVPHHAGKMSASDLQAYLTSFFADSNREHTVQPGMVYLSHPTEYGTLYTKGELEAIHAVCRAYCLPLYVDGARLGYGLAANGTDVTLPILARNCDAFYIGGTKVGALFGEAVVVPTPSLLPHFFTVQKQQGALLAKGWLLGLQFDTLFSDNLYLRISRHAIEMAMLLREGLLAKGYRLAIGSPTNQQFVVLENRHMEELSKIATFGFWETVDATHTVVRFATSWATREEDVRALIAAL